MASLPVCSIGPNPDIVGVGIRASIYAQSCLGAFVALSLFFRNKQEKRDRVLLDNLSKTLHLTGAALTISAMIEARSSTGLSIYHALIVLNLGWLNNLIGFTLHALSWAAKDGNKLDFINLVKVNRVLSLVKSCWAFILHSTLLSILGLWFWSNPNSFARNAPVPAGCTPQTLYWLFISVPVDNHPLRIVSLIAYTITAIPGLNVLIHIIPWVIYASVGALVTDFGDRMAPTATILSLFTFIFLPFLGILFGPTIFFIVATEMVIAANKGQVDQNAEKRWTYGQTLALFMAIMSLWSALYVVWQHWVDGRERQRLAGADQEWNELVNELASFKVKGGVGKGGDAARRREVIDRLGQLDHEPAITKEEEAGVV